MNTTGGYLIGLCTAKVQSDWDESNKQSLAQTSQAWALQIPSDGTPMKKWHERKSTPTGLAGPRAGGVIGVILDCDAHTLTFTVNGERRETTFEGLPDQEFFLAASFGGDETPGGSLRVCLADDPAALWAASTPSRTDSGLDLKLTYYMINQATGFPLHIHQKGDKFASVRYDKETGGRRTVESQWRVEYACQYTRNSSIYYVRTSTGLQPPLQVDGQGDMLTSIRRGLKGQGSTQRVVHGYGGYGDEFAQFKLERCKTDDGEGGEDDQDHCYFIRNVATGTAIFIDENDFGSNAGDVEDDRAKFRFEDSAVFQTVALVKRTAEESEEICRPFLEDFVASVLTEALDVEAVFASAIIKVGRFKVTDLVDCLHDSQKSVIALIESARGESPMEQNMMALLLREQLGIEEPFATSLAAEMTVTGQAVVKCIADLPEIDVTITLLQRNVKAVDGDSKFRPVLEKWAGKVMCDTFAELAKRYKVANVAESEAEYAVGISDAMLGAKIIQCAELALSDLVYCLASREGVAVLLQECSEEQKQAVVALTLAEKLPPAATWQVECTVKAAVKEIAAVMAPAPADMLSCFKEPGVATIISLAQRDAIAIETGFRFRPILDAFVARLLSLTLAGDEQFSLMIVKSAKFSVGAMLECLADVAGAVLLIQNSEAEQMTVVMGVMLQAKLSIPRKVAHGLAGSMTLVGQDLVQCIADQNQGVVVPSEAVSHYLPGIQKLIEIVQWDVSAGEEPFRPFVEGFCGAVLMGELGFEKELAATVVSCAHLVVKDMVDCLHTPHAIPGLTVAGLERRGEKTMALVVAKLSAASASSKIVASKTSLPASTDVPASEPEAASQPAADATAEEGEESEGPSPEPEEESALFDSGFPEWFEHAAEEEVGDAAALPVSMGEEELPLQRITAVSFAGLFLTEAVGFAPELAARIVELSSVSAAATLESLQSPDSKLLDVLSALLVAIGLSTVPAIVAKRVDAEGSSESDAPTGFEADMKDISTLDFAAMYLTQAHGVAPLLAAKIIEVAEFEVVNILDCIKLEEGIVQLFRMKSFMTVDRNRANDRIRAVMALLLRERIAPTFGVASAEGLRRVVELADDIAELMSPKANDLIACINDTEGNTIYNKDHGVHRATVVFNSVIGRNLKEASAIVERLSSIFLAEKFDETFHPVFADLLEKFWRSKPEDLEKTPGFELADRIVEGTRIPKPSGNMGVGDLDHRHCIWHQAIPGKRHSGRYTRPISEIQLVASNSTSILICSTDHAATCRNIIADVDPEIQERGGSPWCACHRHGSAPDDDRYILLRPGVRWPLEQLVAGKSLCRTNEGVGVSAEKAAETWEVTGLPGDCMRSGDTPADQYLTQWLYHGSSPWYNNADDGNGLQLKPGGACEFDKYCSPIEVWLGGERDDVLAQCLENPDRLAPVLAVALKRSKPEAIESFMLMILNSKIPDMTAAHTKVIELITKNMAAEIAENTSDAKGTKVTGIAAIKSLIHPERALSLLQPSIIRWLLLNQLQATPLAAAELANVVTLTAPEIESCLQDSAKATNYVLRWAESDAATAQNLIVPLILSETFHLPIEAARELAAVTLTSTSVAEVLGSLREPASDPRVTAQSKAFSLRAFLKSWARATMGNASTLISIVLSSKIDELVKCWQCRAPRVRLSDEPKPSQSALRVAEAAGITADDIIDWLADSGDLIALLDPKEKMSLAAYAGERISAVVAMMLTENVNLPAETIDYYFVKAMSLSVHDVLRFLTDPGTSWSTLLEYVSTEARSAIVNRVFAKKFKMVPSIAQELCKARMITLDDVVDCLTDTAGRKSIMSKLRFLTWSNMCSGKRAQPSGHCMDHGCDSCGVIIRLSRSVRQLLISVLKVWRHDNPFMSPLLFEPCIVDISAFELQRGHVSMVLEGHIDGLTKLILVDHDAAMVDKFAADISNVLTKMHLKGFIMPVSPIDISNQGRGSWRPSHALNEMDPNEGVSDRREGGPWDLIENEQLQLFWSFRLPQFDKVTPIFLVDKLEKEMVSQPELFRPGLLQVPFDKRSKELLKQVLCTHMDTEMLLPDVDDSDKVRFVRAISVERLSRHFPARTADWEPMNLGDCVMRLMREGDDSWGPASSMSAERLLASVLCDYLHMPEPLAIALARIAAASYRAVAALQTGDKEHLVAQLPKLLHGKGDRLVKLIADAIIKPIFREGLEVAPRFAAEMIAALDRWDGPACDRFIVEIGHVVKDVLCDIIRQTSSPSPEQDAALQTISDRIRHMSKQSVVMLLHGHVEGFTTSLFAGVDPATASALMSSIHGMLQTVVRQKCIMILHMPVAEAELVAKSLVLSVNQRHRVAENELLKVLGELPVAKHFGGEAAVEAAAKLRSAKLRAKAAAFSAMVSGREDNEMPTGTLVRVPGMGVGTIRGFTKNRMAFTANDHEIEFSAGGEPQNVKLKKFEGWEVLPNFDAHDVPALYSSDHNVGGVISDAIVAMVFQQKCKFSKEFAIRVSKAINLPAMEVLHCLIDPVKVRVLKLLEAWTATQACDDAASEICSIVREMLESGLETAGLDEGPKAAAQKALVSFTLDRSHVAMIVRGQWELLTCSVWPKLVFVEVSAMFPGAGAASDEDFSILPLWEPEMKGPNIRTGRCISGLPGDEAPVCGYCNSAAGEDVGDTKTKAAAELFPDEPFLPAVHVDGCSPMLHDLLHRIHKFYEVGCCAQINFQQCQAFSRQLQHTERMLAVANAVALADLPAESLLAQTARDALSKVAEVVEQATAFARSLHGAGFLKDFFMNESDDMRLLQLSRHLNEELQPLHAGLLLNGSIEPDGKEFCVNMRDNVEMRHRVALSGGLFGILGKSDDRMLLRHLTDGLEIDAKTFRTELLGIEEDMRANDRKIMETVTDGPWGVINNLRIRAFWCTRICTECCAKEVLALQLDDWLRGKARPGQARPSVQRVLNELARFGTKLRPDDLRFLHETIDEDVNPQNVSVRDLLERRDTDNVKRVARLLLSNWDAYRHAEIAVTDWSHSDSRSAVFEPDLFSLDLDSFQLQEFADEVDRSGDGSIDVREIDLVFRSTLAIGEQMTQLVESKFFFDESGFFCEDAVPQIPPRSSTAHFYGRNSELNTMSGWLHADTADIIAVFGPGGSGKTSLLIEAAWREHTGEHCEFWGGGIVFADVTGLKEAVEIEHAILQAAGGREEDPNGFDEIITRTNQTAMQASAATLPRMRLLFLDNIDPESEVESVLSKIYKIQPFRHSAGEPCAVNVRVILSTRHSVSRHWKSNSRKVQQFEIGGLGQGASLALLEKLAPTADHDFIQSKDLRTLMGKKMPADIVMFAPPVMDAQTPDSQQRILDLLVAKSGTVEGVIGVCMERKETKPMRERFTNNARVVSLFRPVLESNYYRSFRGLSYATDEASKRRMRLAKGLGLPLRVFSMKGFQQKSNHITIPPVLQCGPCEQSVMSIACCASKVSVSGARRSAASSKQPKADQSLAFGDGSALAVHVWTFSQPTGWPADKPSAIYKQMNRALLKDDPVPIHELAVTMEAIRCWIRAHPAPEAVTLYRGTPNSKAQQHPMGGSQTDTVGAVAREHVHNPELVADAARTMRMPMFIAASKSIAKAREFCTPGCPILEFIVPKGCRNCTPVSGLSHYPEEEEWLMPPYTAVKFIKQRVEENMLIGTGKKAVVMSQLIVTYEVLDWEESLAKFERATPPQPLKSCLVMCEISGGVALPPLTLAQIAGQELKEPTTLVKFEAHFTSWTPGGDGGLDLPIGFAGALQVDVVAQIGLKNKRGELDIAAVSVDNIRQHAATIIVAMSVRVQQRKRSAVHKASRLTKITAKIIDTNTIISSTAIDEVFVFDAFNDPAEQYSKDVVNLALVTPEGATFDAETAGVITTSPRDSFADKYVNCAGLSVVAKLELTVESTELLGIRFTKMYDEKKEHCVAVVNTIDRSGVAAAGDTEGLLKRDLVLGYVKGVPLGPKTKFSQLMSQLGSAVTIELGFIRQQPDWKLTVAGSERKTQAWGHGDQLLSELMGQNFVENPSDARFRMNSTTLADIAKLKLLPSPDAADRHARHFLNKLATICSLISEGKFVRGYFPCFH